ncbi:MAG: hypothetical protein ACRBFS_03900 [Aureispira sp.]
MNPKVRQALALLAQLEELGKNDPSAKALIEQKRRELAKLTAGAGREEQKKIIELAKTVMPNLEEAPEVERAKANQVVADFMTTATASVYDKVTQADFVKDLKERVNDPEKVDQDSLNLCGPAAYCVLWAKHDPEGYAKAAIELYKKGSYTYNGKTITANEDVYEQTPPSGMSPVDWMMLAAIRHNENAIFDYNPKTDKGHAAFTTHWELTAWLSNIVGVSEYRDGSPTVAKINTAFNANKTVVLLVDWGQISKNNNKKGKGGSKKSGKPDSYINSVTGNHYIIMASPIVTNGEQLEFTIWTWAQHRNIVLDKVHFEVAVKDSFTVNDTNQ